MTQATSGEEVKPLGHQCRVGRLATTVGAVEFDLDEARRPVAAAFDTSTRSQWLQAFYKAYMVNFRGLWTTP